MAGRQTGREHAAHGRHSGLVGPNAVIQLETALVMRSGCAIAEHVMTAAGLAHYSAAPPTSLVPEGEPARLFQALRNQLPAHEADAVLALAGRLTADYILAHRIPQPAQRLLRALPRSLGVRALLAAIQAHAWTFAGSGKVTISPLWQPPALFIQSNPLSTPGCPWHVGVIEQLVRVCGAPRARVSHHRSGAGFDAFDIEV